MNKNNPRCDVHMNKKKPKAEFLFLWLQFLGGIMCFHLDVNFSQPKEK